MLFKEVFPVCTEKHKDIHKYRISVTDYQSGWNTRIYLALGFKRLSMIEKINVGHTAHIYTNFGYFIHMFIIWL